MKPPKFDYHAARSLDEAVALLDRYQEGARILAGGQSLVPLLNFRIMQPVALVSINHCAQLSYIREEAGGITIGALTRQAQAEQSPVVARRSPLLAAALPLVGGIANRNRGTVCGSIAHADPLAELTAVAAALGARMNLVSASGKRTVEAADFFEGELSTCMRPGEMLESVFFPDRPARSRDVFLEVGNRAHGFAVVGLAASFEIDDRGRCTSARLAAIGVSDKPARLLGAERALCGADRPEHAGAEAGAIAAAETRPFGSYHADAAYKTDVLSTLVQRAVAQALSQSKAGVAA